MTGESGLQKPRSKRQQVVRVSQVSCWGGGVTVHADAADMEELWRSLRAGGGSSRFGATPEDEADAVQEVSFSLQPLKQHAAADMMALWDSTERLDTKSSKLAVPPTVPSNSQTREEQLKTHLPPHPQAR